MERRLVGPGSIMPGSSQAADVDDLASEVAGLRLQLVESLEELEARERELQEARDTALGQHHKMQALSDQVRQQLPVLPLHALALVYARCSHTN